MLRTTPRPYQSEAVRRALRHDGFALFPEQRTGKTLVTLAIVDRREPDVLLIICPKKAVREWEDQIERHLDIDWDCTIEIVHYEACSRTKKQRKHYRRLVRKWLKQGLTVFVVCDEAHRIKRRGSMQARFVRSLGHLVTWRLALTGTPIAQGIQDAWSIFDFIMRGSLEWTWASFSEEYLKWGGFESKKIVGYKNEEQFHEIFHRYSYRVTFKEAKQSMGELPPKIRRRKIFFDLKPASRQAYGELEQELETIIDGVTISTPLVLTLTMKLQQLAGGFLIQDLRVPGRKRKKRLVVPVGQEKLEALADLLPTLGDRKLVICARFRHELQKIGELVEVDRTYKMIAGGHEFNGEFDTDVILLQVQSGVAIDLSMSNSYIFYSWDFSYINYEQSRFRVMSFDTEQVNYYFLMARETVDEDIYEAVSKKKDLATLVCDRVRKEHHVKQTSRTKNRGNQRRAEAAHS